MLGGYFQKLTKGNLHKLAAQVYKFANAKNKRSEKLVVTYVTRPSPRCLEPSLEKELLSEIRKLQNIELQVVALENTSFAEQINIVANTRCTQRSAWKWPHAFTVST